jgi:hypothetical protein
MALCSSCSGRMVAGVPLAKLLLLVFISLQVLYPGIMYSALTVFYCVQVAVPTGVVQQGSGRVLGQVSMSSLLPAAAAQTGATGPRAAEMHTVSLWVLDMEQQCYQGYHLKVLLPMAVLVLFVVGLGLPACDAAMAAAASGRFRQAQRPASLSSSQQSGPQLLEQPPGPAMFSIQRQSSAPASAWAGTGGLQRQLSHSSQVLSRQTSSLVDSAADWYRPGAAGTSRCAAAGGLSRQTSGASEVASGMPSLLFSTGSGTTACPLSAPFYTLSVGQIHQGSEQPPQQPSSQSPWGAGGAGDATPWYVIVSRCLAGSVRDGMQWWPAAQLLMLFALVAAAVFGAPTGPGVQPGFVLLVVGSMMVTVVLCRPYSCPRQTGLILLCLSVMAGLLYVAQMLAVCAPSAVPGAISQLCTLSVPAAVTSTLLLVLLLVPVGCTVWSIRKEFVAAAYGMMTGVVRWATRRLA